MKIIVSITLIFIFEMMSNLILQHQYTYGNGYNHLSIVYPKLGMNMFEEMVCTGTTSKESPSSIQRTNVKPDFKGINNAENNIIPTKNIFYWPILQALASAALDYADSNKRDKRLTEILDVLNLVHQRFDEVLDGLKELGVYIDTRIVDTYNASVKNELVGTMTALDTYIRFPGGTDVEHLKPRFEVLTNILMNQINDPAYIEIIGAAMVAHHDIFYLRRNIPGNTAQAQYIMSRYNNYFISSEKYLEDLIVKKEPAKKSSRSRLSLLKNPVTGIYYIYEYTHPLLRQFTDRRKYAPLELTYIGTEQHASWVKTREMPFPRFHYYQGPFRGDGSCAQDFLDCIESIDVMYTANLNELQPKLDECYLNFQRCAVREVYEIDLSKDRLKNVREFIKMAARWAENPYENVEHLQHITD